MKADPKALTKHLMDCWDSFLKGTEQAIAIFVIDDNIKHLPVTQQTDKQLNKMLKDYFHHTVGVYNRNAKFSDVLVDMKYTARNL